MVKDYFFDLSLHQSMQGHEVHVLTWKKNNSVSQNLAVDRVDDFRIHRLRGLNFGLYGAFQDYPYLPELPCELEQLNPDIVHAESHLFLPSVQALRKAKELNIPFVLTIHGVFANRGLVINTTQKSYLHFISRTFKKANRIICLTKSDACEIARYGFPEDKIRLVPNAVDTQRFRPGCEQNDNLVLWVGRFVPEKGLEHLIKAAKIVASKKNNVKFLLIGYGPLKNKIMQLAAEYGLLGVSVYFSDSMSRDEISKIMRKAAFLAFPSLKEGMPLSVLEALACGLPIIGFNVSGLNELVVNGENGLLVQPRNNEALANAIICLLNDKALRTKLSDRARQLAVEKYQWPTVLSALENVYDEAIN
jgi:glycosyltransferase involved in cell wall biosynthesis